MAEAARSRPAGETSPSSDFRLTRRDLAACVAAGGGASFLFILLTYVKAPERVWLGLLALAVFPLGMLAAAFVGARLSKRFPAAGAASKFGIVGILNTAIDLSLLTLLVVVTGVARGPFYALFKAASFLAAASNSYMWNRHWSFAPVRRRRASRPILEGREFLRFLLLTTVSLGISTGVASALVELYRPAEPTAAVLWATGAAAIASVASAVWNFCAYRYLVFRRTPPTDDASSSPRAWTLLEAAGRLPQPGAHN